MFILASVLKITLDHEAFDQLSDIGRNLTTVADILSDASLLKIPLA